MGEDRYGIEMTNKEIVEFLTRQGHGVLSFGGDEPYGLPISFGYDVMNNRCVFQLVFGPGSKKRSHIEESDAVNLVAYDWQDPDEWRSIIVDGRLRSIDDDTPAAIEAAGVFAEYASIAGLTVFNRPIDELEPEWYELRVEEMSGYKAPLSD